VYKALARGLHGGSYTIMDATSRDRLPVGVSGTRIPAWMLPSVPLDTLPKLRPDILMVHGLSPAAAPSATSRPLSPSALRAMQCSCTVHVVELGFTHESLYANTLATKHAQHAQLINFLVADGWTVFHAPDTDPVPHVILLGTSGTIYSLILPVLKALGVSPSHIPPLLKSLHLLAVQYADKLVRARRRLENSPAFHSCIVAHPYPP
jgi:hypothetical protein